MWCRSDYPRCVNVQKISPELANHFLSQVAEEGLPWKTIEKPALERLKQHNWPGNVRELENVIRRLAALYSQETITLEVIQQELAELNAQSANGGGDSDPDNLSSAIEKHLRSYFDAHGDSLPPSGLYDRVLKELERPLLSMTLEATNGNQIKSAQLLGLNRNTLRKKIRELNIPITKNAVK